MNLHKMWGGILCKIAESGHVDQRIKIVVADVPIQIPLESGHVDQRIKIKDSKHNYNYKTNLVT